jgi:hypothetical protein
MYARYNPPDGALVSTIYKIAQIAECSISREVFCESLVLDGYAVLLRDDESGDLAQCLPAFRTLRLSTGVTSVTGKREAYRSAILRCFELIMFFVSL